MTFEEKADSRMFLEVHTDTYPSTTVYTAKNEIRLTVRTNNNPITFTITQTENSFEFTFPDNRIFLYSK